MRRRGFTLIELLVVITVIVVLIAMLTPALDRAVYQAELTVCGTSLRGVGQSMTLYTSDHRRRYPWRAPGGTQSLINFGTPDLMVQVRGYIDINASLNCPLTRPVDLAGSLPGTEYVRSSYNLWFGYQYVGERGMLKYGDRVEFAGDRFDVLAGDLDWINEGANAYAVGAAHPDHDNVMVNNPLQDSGLPRLSQTQSWWQVVATGTDRRGDIDTNFARDDGSVDRYLDVAWDEAKPESNGRMVALFFNSDNRNAALRSALPKP